MNILGVTGGNGVMLYPFRKWLIANYEPRKVYKTPNEIQWYLNFKAPKWDTLYTFEKEVDVIIGHPDCGNSSMMSLTRIKKFTNPKDNESLQIFLWSIDRFKPKVWLMENLPKLLETISIQDFRKMFPDYVFFHHIGSVMDFGNSQRTRKRLIIIGIRRDIKEAKKLINVYQVAQPQKSKYLLLDLPQNGHIHEPINEVITLYAGYKASLQEIKERWISELKNKTRWPVEGRNFKNAPGVYKNLANGYPATARKQNRQFNHHGEQMSPRELARIQGVPDEFKIWVDEDRIKTCINKGRLTVTKCPPYEIGLWFNDILNLLVQNGFLTRARTHI